LSSRSNFTSSAKASTPLQEGPCAMLFDTIESCVCHKLAARRWVVMTGACRTRWMKLMMVWRSRLYKRETWDGDSGCWHHRGGTEAREKLQQQGRARLQGRRGE
jgi:hypothetical protein